MITEPERTWKMNQTIQNPNEEPEEYDDVDSNLPLFDDGNQICTIDDIEGHVFGVVTSKEKAIEAINYFRNIDPNRTLTYHIWKENYFIEPLVWGWAYIAPNENRNQMLEGGSAVPLPKYFGINLLSNKWRGTYE